MTLPSFGHQARVVALSYTTKRKEVLSRANRLISARYLWVTLSLFGNHTRTVAFNSFPKTWKKQRMSRGWAWKHCIANEGATYPLLRHPWMRHYNPLYVLNPMPSESWSLTTSSTLHGLERDLLETLLDLGQGQSNRTPRQPSHIQDWEVT